MEIITRLENLKIDFASSKSIANERELSPIKGSDAHSRASFCSRPSLVDSPTGYLEDHLDMLKSCVKNCDRLKSYKLLGIIGHGTFGVVLEAIHLGSGIKVAIKIIRKAFVPSAKLCFDEQKCETILQEYALVKKCIPRHPNIIHHFDCFSDQFCWYVISTRAGHEWSKESIDPSTNMPVILSQIFGSLEPSPLPLTDDLDTLLDLKKSTSELFFDCNDQR